MISDRNLTKGTKLVGHYHKQEYGCRVIEVESGKFVYVLDDGREFKSLSAAAVAITGTNCNGWAFWSVAGTEAPARKQRVTKNTPATEQKAEEVPIVTKDDKGRSIIRRVANQHAAPKGQVLWRCYNCDVSFFLPEGETALGCPGHPASR